MTKRIKKIAGLLSLAAFCLIVPVARVKAEDTENQVTQNGYYTVTIPAEVTIPHESRVQTIPIKAKLASDTNLVVSIKSANKFNLVNGANQIKYTISDTKPLVFSNETAGEVEKNYNLKLRLANKTLLYSGEYTDTLTFTMSATNNTEETNYCLNFNLNADNDPNATITTYKKVLKNGEKYGTLPTPVRTGYDFVGWYTSQEEQDDNHCVNENTLMEMENVDLYAKWEIRKFNNTITFWAWGLEEREGNNGPENAIQIGEDKTIPTPSEYGSTFTYTQKMAEDAGVEIPRGYELKQFGSATVGNATAWQRYTFTNGEYGLTQPDWSVNAEYEYDVIHYKITYELDGGTNNSANPSSYTVLYGVTFKEPAKAGYTFDGWYIDNKKVTGINEKCVNDFKGIEDKSEARTKFYAALKDRQIGDVTVTAHWKKDSDTDDKDTADLKAAEKDTEKAIVNEDVNQDTETEVSTETESEDVDHNDITETASESEKETEHATESNAVNEETEPENTIDSSAETESEAVEDDSSTVNSDESGKETEHVTEESMSDNETESDDAVGESVADEEQAVG